MREWMRAPGHAAGPAPQVPAVLVTGGAGFVGSHACKALAAAGFLPVAYDDLSNGSRCAVRWGPLEVGDVADHRQLATVLARHRAVAAMHFAARIEAAESLRDPAVYLAANADGTWQLLRAMRQAGVRHLVFSSSAAVYGAPAMLPVPEAHALRPLSPYGGSKLLAERMLAESAAIGGPRWVALRYFNAAGADPDAELAENHRLETHLIPLALRVALGHRPYLEVHGIDYATPDGTCIRDYVHVSDLADAHVLALRRLLAGGEPLVANLGTGRGASVLAVVDAVRAATGRPVPLRARGRRPGDPPRLVADARLARDALGWRPHFPELADMVRHALSAMRCI
ncbi:MAG: UDP-glucose 4-epimerase GalE [Thalassobaculum sp.]|uniref:UDP-glucose 4-epimerase GalE n=1 Tax=Thalassobaculum sp. TaxID=2022740 RepID=UPI0032EAEF86